MDVYEEYEAARAKVQRLTEELEAAGDEMAAAFERLMEQRRAVLARLQRLAHHQRETAQAEEGEAMKWRAVFTDTERQTGVAPVCEMTGHLEHMQDDPTGVYDCCPHPHIEMWDERAAAELAARLTELGAEPCS